MFETILLLLLQSYCVNYPILREIGYRITKPIAIVGKNLSMAVEFAKKISKNPLIIEQNMSIQEITESLIFCNSKAAIVMVPTVKNLGKKAEQMLQTAQSAAEVGSCSGYPVTSAIFYICEKKVPDDYKGHTLEFHIEHIPTAQYDATSIVRPEAYRIHDIVKRICDLYGTDSEVAPFMAAIEFMEDIRCETCREELRRVAGESLCISDAYADDCKITPLVYDELIHYFEKNPDAISPNWGNALGKDSHLDGFILDGDYLMARDAVFKRAIADLLKLKPINVIKEKLLAEGTLKADAGGYTCKTSLENGDDRRIRVLKIKISDCSELKAYGV